MPLKEIKSLPKIYELLKNHKCYLNEHRWTEDVWDTVQLGFFQGTNPQFYSADNATTMISNAIKKSFPKAKIPKFQIVFCSPQTKSQNIQLRTKAYAIETEKATSMERIKMLKHTYGETTEFVPFQMRSKHPDAYARILSQQSRMIADQHVIVMQYITPDTMYYLTDRIAAIDGVIDLLEVTNGEEIGKYRVLVHKDDFHKARKSLQANLPTWYAECVPDDAKPTQDRFPGTPEVAPIMSDGYSSREDSYYSSSVNTALSYDSVSSDITTDTSIKSTVTNNDDKTEPSWAQRVSNGATPDKGSTPPPGAPNSVQPNPIDASIISDLASSRAEVEDLKAQLSKMQVQQDTERQEQVRQAEHQKKEAEILATAQQLELDKKAEDQRRLFHQQLEDQRREMKKLAAQQRSELEAKMQDQITRAIQDHMNRSPAPVTPDLHQMFVDQGRQIQLLTRMMMKQMSPPAPPPVAQVSTGKRSAEATKMTEGVDEEFEYPEEEHLNTPESRKRVDLKRTPQKSESSRTEATTPSSVSMESPLAIGNSTSRMTHIHGHRIRSVRYTQTTPIILSILAVMDPATMSMNAILL